MSYEIKKKEVVEKHSNWIYFSNWNKKGKINVVNINLNYNNQDIEIFYENNFINKKLNISIVNNKNKNYSHFILKEKKVRELEKILDENEKLPKYIIDRIKSII